MIISNEDIESAVDTVMKLRYARDRIAELEEALHLISTARAVSANPLDLIDNLCDEVI